MKIQLLRLALPLALVPALLVVAPLAPAVHAATKKTSDAATRHPLKGVIVAIDADLSALRVKHEEIPGVMRAMTMLFKVDAATLKSVQTGDEITALMSRQDGEWRLAEVKVTARKTK